MKFPSITEPTCLTFPFTSRIPLSAAKPATAFVVLCAAFPDEYPAPMLEV